MGQKTFWPLLLMGLGLLPGCRTYHGDGILITQAEVCEDTVLGEFNGKVYGLSPADRPLYVACYSPIAPEDVGKRFHARADGRVLLIDVPERGTVRFDVVSEHLK